MKTKLLFLLIFSTIVLFKTNQVIAADWSRLADLEGSWSFSLGDDMNWAKPELDVSNWDRINVPENWDDYYNEYNGFGWYRKTFDMVWIPEKNDLILFLGQIDDVDEVFINGVKVGQSGSFLPNFETAYNVERAYYIPKDLLKKTNNVIAVRVYDTSGPGGILGGNRIGVYFDEDYNLLSQDLSGLWKFSIHRDGDVYDANFNDSKWKSIKVPGYWENHGYADYDGVAWYRTKFKLDDKLKSEDNLYLVLGKIDDMDKVYLNGEQFARTEYLDKYSKLYKYNAYRLYRVYKLPKSRLKSENVLVVEVRDDQQGGGIYEGPVGIMTQRNAQVILSREEDEFWYNPIQYFFNLFNF